MKITELNITQFRGISDLFFTKFGKTNVFCGKNGIGKSTIIDCIMWMLCDETFTYGLQNDNNKNKHNTKDVIEVEMKVVDNNNNEFELKRTYFEKWKGEEFQKIENKFEINGAKYTSTEYLEKIRNIIGINTNIKTKKINILRLMMDTSYLENIDYKIARDFIEEILGVVSDTDLANDPKYEIIRNGLLSQQNKEGKFDIVKTKSLFKKNLDGADASIEEIKNQIKRDKALLSEFPEDEANKIEEEKTKLLSMKVEDNEEYKIKTKELNDTNTKIESACNTIETNIKELQEKIDELIVKGNKIQNDITLNDNEKSLVNEKIEAINFSIKELAKQYKDIEKEEFTEVKCPECGYVLNTDKKNAFEDDKKKKLLEIKNIASQKKEEKKQLDDRLAVLEKDTADLKETFNATGKEYAENFKQLTVLKNDLEDNEEVKALKEKQTKLQTEISNLTVAFENTKNEKINELIVKASEFGSIVQLKNNIEQNEKEVEELKKQKALAEMQLQCLEDFKQFKLKLTRENTNKIFPNIEFEMLYESPTTGVLTECCYPKYKDVEFNGLNNGNRYPLGIEVIEDVKRALNITEDLPILIDRRADLDEDNLNAVIKLTDAQIFTTLVTNDTNIKLNKGE